MEATETKVETWLTPENKELLQRYVDLARAQEAALVRVSFAPSADELQNALNLLDQDMETTWGQFWLRHEELQRIIDLWVDPDQDRPLGQILFPWLLRIITGWDKLAADNDWGTPDKNLEMRSMIEKRRGAWLVAHSARRASFLQEQAKARKAAARKGKKWYQF